MLQVMKETWTMIRETILYVYIYTKRRQIYQRKNLEFVDTSFFDT